MLRFPEFRDAGEWKVDILSGKGISFFVKERMPLEKLNIENYVSTENLLPDYGGVTIASKLPPAGSFTRFRKGDILISNIRPYLKKVWSANMDGAASNDIIIIRADTNVSESFLSFLLKNDDFINYIMIGVKGVKMPRGDKSLMEEYPVPFPTDSEQQKIASCLSSIDDFITAQTQKLDALKVYKNGLMQKLFPADGETVPQLRFPEFRDRSEWEKHTLENICISLSSGKDKSDDNGIYSLYGSTGIIGKTSSYTYDGNFILVARVGANAGLLNKASGKFGATDNTLVIILKKTEKLDFIYYSLDNLRLNNLVFGSGQPLITGKQLKDLDINLPLSNEQQKIADCLSSLDELINTQNQKIKTLKIHKKALMQQLFPSMEN